MEIPNLWILGQYRCNTKFKTGDFFSHSKQKDNMITFDKMTEQGLPEYQINFPLFIVSHKNSKCVDFVSTGETHIDILEALSMPLCQI